MTLPAHVTEKARLRSALRSNRAGLDPIERHEQSHAMAGVVAEYVGGLLRPSGGSVTQRPVVTAYLGVDPEPDTAPLLARLHALGVDVVLPICEPQYRLSWTVWTPGVALQRSVRAPVDEPVGPRRSFEQLSGVRLILVPALGVDRSGQRIGQGGGYYDRFLARHPRTRADTVPRIGIVYRSEVLPEGAIPAEPHDQPLDAVFTADGLLRLRADDSPV
jgi:5-formyltetrahydrofolate cyclo-ligase